MPTTRTPLTDLHLDYLADVAYETARILAEQVAYPPEPQHRMSRGDAVDVGFASVEMPQALLDAGILHEQEGPTVRERLSVLRLMADRYRR